MLGLAWLTNTTISSFFLSLNNCLVPNGCFFVTLIMLNEFDGLKNKLELSLSLIFWILNWLMNTYTLLSYFDFGLFILLAE